MRSSVTSSSPRGYPGLVGQRISTPNLLPVSHTPSHPSTLTRVPASPASSSAGNRESHVRIGELCRHVKDLEDRLEAIAKEHATIQNWLLAQLIAQNGLESIPLPDVSAGDSRLDACLKRIVELEKEVEASRKAREARQNDEDFMTFEDEENLDAEFLSLSCAFLVGPVEREFGEGRKYCLELELGMARNEKRAFGVFESWGAYLRFHGCCRPGRRIKGWVSYRQIMFGSSWGWGPGLRNATF
ncbi:uncharacterized protein BDZ99DRAFT_531157 [Mytilinidion resinicola]|uniref:Uncharacterized protein n=1 Tax=Mytilinidion resinicola TaxID=574789 RepID=A0A6A6ZA01_9PEZI|nr:uncharacterized protein BDZ99DRAFT_531157 [Mytilinidion resinicola]KAF2817952.1 hypothetical protein BDZ99DRAFT_531157 [Mytilinidion resinicola]